MYEMACTCDKGVECDYLTIRPLVEIHHRTNVVPISRRGSQSEKGEWKFVNVGCRPKGEIMLEEKRYTRILTVTEQRTRIELPCWWRKERKWRRVVAGRLRITSVD